MSRRKKLDLPSTVKVVFAGQYVRRISHAEFARLRERGRALPIHDSQGRLVGCELTNNHPGDGPIPSQPGGPVITAREMEMYAGRAFKGGKSQTEQLTETQRLERASRTSTRTGKRLPPEDAIERVAEKVRLQTVTVNFHDGRDRAPRAYPKARG